MNKVEVIAALHTTRTNIEGLIDQIEGLDEIVDQLENNLNILDNEIADINEITDMWSSTKPADIFYSMLYGAPEEQEWGQEFITILAKEQ